MQYKKHPERLVEHWLASPFIYMMIIPLVILDIFLEVYHNIVFRLLKIPLVKRSQYIKIDRQRLQYLKWYDRIYCAYCGYANGLIYYALRIAGDTEKYWCGIKHQQEADFHNPPHHKNFVEYGDKKSFNKKFK